MSDPRSVRGGKENVESVVTPPFPPQFYPMPGYQGPPWFPGQVPAGPPPPWPASWSSAPVGFPAPPTAWSSPQSMMPSSTTSTTAAIPSDEYTVDTMRRIYNDDDGRVEIQRVKVQRRPPDAGAIAYPSGPEAMSVVPVGSFPLNERRPPPRKKKQLQALQAAQGQGYPWYPYMPCMPYPVPYPYYYGGCMWTPGAPTSHMGSVPAWSGQEESERTSSRQDSLPTTLDSQRLESRTSDPLRGSISPVSQRSPSPAAGSHVTDAHSLAPSDSVSMRGYKRESSLERALMCPTPPPRTKSRSSERKSSTDVGKMQEWMVDMHKAILGPNDGASDRASYATAPTDVEPYKRLPPRRKKHAARLANLSGRGSIADQKELDDALEKRSITSIGSDDSLKLSSELTYAFRKLEQSVDAFKTKVSSDSTPVHTPQRMPSPPPLHSSGDDTPTEAMEDALVSLDVTGADKGVTDVTSAEEPSSPPPLETISPTFFNEGQAAQTSKEEGQTVAKAEDIPSSLTTSETSSSQTSVATTLQTTDVSAAQPGEAEPAKTTPPAASPEAKETHPASPQTTEGTPASLSTEKPTEETQTIPKTTETTSTATPTEQQTPALDKTAPPHPPLPSDVEAKANEAEEASGRESRASESTFFSIRASDDQLLVDTDSTDILLPTTDATTADEGEEHTDSTVASPTLEEGNEGYQWVLQQPGETPELTGAKEDEQKNAWRAEVSLWRARLVVSLCRGRGLDRQDWSTFHLLVRHPLTLDLKLSLLHAPRLCAANSTVGAALVRVALIHLAQYGEALLQPDSSRQTGWRSIKVDPNQSWAPVKGAIEILQALGYKQREDGVLRYPRRSTTEVSVLARLTLDMLVLAEELRLYLTGMHQYPTNISDLFFSATSPITPSPDPLMQDMPPRPQSSASSYSFLSAQSSASLDRRPDSRLSVTDEETETLQISVQHTKGSTKKARRDSSSEEEVTLREDSKDAKGDSTEAVQDELGGEMPSEEAPLPTEVLRKKEDIRSGSVLSLPVNPIDRSSLSTMTSMPDLQSLRSSTVSRDSQHRPNSNNSAAPASTPTGEAPTGNDNPEDHIYEEIDVIRAQVQALRSASVPAHSPPPPLPPKKKVSSGGEDDSNLSVTYPSMEWTSASTPGSLRGGSTGARRKKRRAPMPPDFMPPDWRPYQNRDVQSASSPTQDRQLPESLDESKESEEERKKKEEYRRSLNPFYEDIDSVKEKVKEIKAKEEEKNPFVKEDVAVAGYIGKNPFYEDVELLKKDTNETAETTIKNKDYDKLQNTRTSEDASSLKQDGKVCGMGSLAELQDDTVLSRPKRKAPRPPPTPDPTSISVAENTSATISSSEVTESTASTQQSPSAPQPATSSRPPSAPQRPPTPRSSSIPRTASTPQPSSTDPSTPQHPPTPQRPPTPKRPATPRRASTQEASATPDVPNQEEPVKNADADDTRPPIPVKLRNGEKNNANTSSKAAASQSAPQSSPQPQQDVKEPESQKEQESRDKTEEARQVVSRAIKNQQQRLQLQHPKTPPPPPPAASKPASPPSEAKALEETKKEPKNDQSATTPSKASLAFLEDIPYMDANEVKDAKSKTSEAKDQQTSQYEIPEPPGKVVVPAQLSPTVMRQTALLLRGSRMVPFIDESDLPPDCPPPPPPGPPPDSPPTSPPETPHTSPPETPHTSPPETPQGSPVPSRVTISLPGAVTAAAPNPGVKKTESDKPPETRQLGDTADASQKAEDKDQPPALPPKTSPSSTSPKTKTTESRQTTEQTTPQRKPSDDKPPKATRPQDSTGAEQPKKEHEPASSQPSVRSSVSEDRYEIPDTSKPLPASPEPSQAAKTDSADDPKGTTQSPPKDQPSEPYVPTSESDKYEIPEVAKEAVVEERYEIPEVVKETAANGGASSVKTGSNSCILL
ncbi:titin homolog isoform X2 [Penaeus japonicus]|uniref:titin homolog isoform X2 n=1 Tax=Penaeus japonicus TaxID=27405 RepID=UPI001C711572|nr:titin homolog isoform X2 [Penaeus japonicus]